MSAIAKPFISHDSAIATFFHNPEQGSRDAANIVDMDVEWNRYLTTTEARMAQDIRHAVDNGIEGIIASIPNNLVFEAIQYANSKRVPIIVFNSGLEYAKSLGLARVMQDDVEAGLLIGQSIENVNFSRPLVVHLSNMDHKTINLRINGIQKAMLGKKLGVLNITETLTNSTFTPVQLISDTFKNGLYDSIISLGGSMCADLVSTAMLGIKQKYPDLSIASGFFDVGGNNMTELFHKEENTFAVTQLPYYQTALPVFYMYLRLTTGHDIYFNRTIKTGPNLITNATLSMVLQNEQNSLMNINDKFGSIGAIVPNTRGDTYNAAMMAGVVNLAHKLNWTVINPIKEDPLDIPKTFHHDLDFFMRKHHTNNIIIQTSDHFLLDYASNRSKTSPDVGVAAIGSFFERFNTTYPEMPNIGLDMNELAKSVAKAVFEDGKGMPYQTLLGNSGQPDFSQVVQSIFVSSPSAMEDEFVETLNKLSIQGYTPDSFITFSEYVFSIINNRMLKGYLSDTTALYTAGELFDQNRAFLEGRVKGLWATNMFSIGFMTLLYSLLSKVMVSFPSWEGALISVPRILQVCEPGTYHLNLTTSAYCQDSEGHTHMSIQCIQCPENTYSSEPNQGYCDACEYGTYSSVGSSACISCYSAPKIANNTICAGYIAEQEVAHRQLYMAIFIPIGIFLFAVIIGVMVWYFKRRFLKQRALGSDENWLLSFDELVKPQISEGPGDRENAFIKEKQRDIIMGASGRLLIGGSSSDPASGMVKRGSTPVIGQEQTITNTDDSHRLSNGGITLTPSLPEANLIGALETEGGIHHKRGGSKSDGIKFQAENSRLIHALGFYRNLPVYIKQIGCKKIRVDAKIRREVSLVKDARHTNLIEFIGLILEPQRTFIVEEYCTKGSLSDVLANPDINLAWIFRFSLINDLISGMRFLHRSKFLYHGCLTSNDCMITGRWELKISNYGFNRIRNSQLDLIDPPTLVRKQSSSFNVLFDDVTPSHDQVARVLKSQNTLLWLAPESVVATPSNVYITFPSKPADVYSVGIIINEILTREKPYASQLHGGLSPEIIFGQICDLELRPRMQPSGQDDFTYGMNLIVSDCLQRNSNERPSLNAIASRVEELDPYFCGSGSVVDNMAVLLEKYGNDMENLVKKRTFYLQQRTLELEEERARTETLLKGTSPKKKILDQLLNAYTDLKLAKEVAEAAAASKQSFLANMSHEIRTPMNAVIGMSRTLMESDLPPDLYECAETIESSGNHLMALIDDILDYSKIDSGKLTLERSMLDLTYVVESAIKLISSNYLSKGLVLWYNIAPDLPIHVFGDIVRLRQILLNLLSNAFKFTQTGYVYVSVELYKHALRTPSSRGDDEDDDCVMPYSATVPASQSPSAKENDINPLDITQYLFSVKDTGIGIPKEKANRLFKSFSQVDASTTRNFGGTGLGLAISKKLCKIMGGDMWVESDEGVGSTFLFKVNLQKQPNSNTYSEENHLAEFVKACPRPLIIAERETVQLEWNSILKNLGIDNITAMNLKEIYTNFKQKNISKDSYSIIIIDMDFELPNENEEQSTTSQSVLRRLKKEYTWVQHTPTLCVVDSRLKRTRKRVSEELEANFSNSAIQHPQGFREPVPTPIDEIINPFDSLPQSRNSTKLLTPHSSTNSANANLTPLENKIHLVIKKPFKNSSLISILHELFTGEQRPLRKQRLGSAGSNSHRLVHRISDRGRQASTEEGEQLMAYLASIKTLVVDDNPVNLKVLSRMLTQIGISSEKANNGREAYEIILNASKTEEPFQLVFMDIWMPELNGFEATEKIRKEAASSATQPYIIALTACVMTGDREKCMEAGMNGYVSKPIRKEELEAAIHTFTQTTSTSESSDL
ncbi:hypothetical protein INT48_004714 [Thamnidium elegans]|uniref:Guanylate cyclase n=1 Tax=Thamnidium elegans TaxID=101142 RepID=A0A8H7SU27_9FUNG|nr:hypothetical protein INT48_004714 [Thamnidium elegans]